MEGQGKSWMVFSHDLIDVSGEKSYGWWVGLVDCKIIVSAPSPFPLDFGFRIWDLDVGLGFGTCIWDLDLRLEFGIDNKKCFK